MRNRRNYYRILHLQPDAPFAVVKANYRTLMQKLRVHPDLGGDEWKAALVNAAYATLRDPAKRAAYDSALLRKHDIATVARGRLGPPRRPQRGMAGETGVNRRNYYRVLQVQPGAPTAVIDASYRSLRRGGAVVADLLDDAYRTLMNAGARAEYDRSLARDDHVSAVPSGSGRRRAGPMGGFSSAQVHRSETPSTGRARAKRRPAVGKRRNPWTGAVGYQPVITRYCSFCRTPYRRLSGPVENAICAECESPLGMPHPNRTGRAGRALPRIGRNEVFGFYTYWPGPRLDGILRDLSPSGMQFQAPVDLPGSIILRIDARVFQATGRVAHCRPTDTGYRVGIQFVTARFSKPRGGFFSSTV